MSPGDGGGNGMFALGHPEKLIDFGYRALLSESLFILRRR